MSEMKLIMENWRGHLTEIDANDPVTYGLLKSILKIMTGAKQGLVGDALAKFAGLKGATDDAQDLIKMVGSLGSVMGEEVLKEEFGVLNEEETKAVLNEVVLTLGVLWGGLKVIGLLSQAKGMASLGLKIFKKLRGQPTDATDKLPFLDLLNLDPKYSAIVDDRIEEEFLKWWLAEIDQKSDGDNVDTADLDVNAKLIEFLNSEYGRQLAGHDPATGVAGAGTTGAYKGVEKATRIKRAKGTAAQQVGE